MKDSARGLKIGSSIQRVYVENPPQKMMISANAVVALNDYLDQASQEGRKALLL